MTLYKSAKAKMVSRIVIFSTSAVIAIILLLSYYGLNVGTFTVVIDNDQQQTADIALSEYADFQKVSTRLTATQAVNLDCLGEEDYKAAEENPDIKNNIPQEILAAIDDIQGGSQNKEGYLCYTFYVMNSGNVAYDYSMELSISSTKNNADSAVRIMLVWDREYNVTNSQLPEIRTIYAKAQGTKPRQTPGALDYCCDERFYSSTKIFSVSRPYFAQGIVDRVTVLMWIHGWDEDSTDEVKEGKVRLSLRIGVTDIILE